MRAFAALSLAFLPAVAAAQAPTPAPVTEEWPGGDVVPVHDPVLIREGDTWHVFSTGLGEGAQG